MSQNKNQKKKQKPQYIHYPAYHLVRQSETLQHAAYTHSHLIILQIHAILHTDSYLSSGSNRNPGAVNNIVLKPVSSHAGQSETPNDSNPTLHNKSYFSFVLGYHKRDIISTFSAFSRQKCNTLFNQTYLDAQLLHPYVLFKHPILDFIL